MGAMEVTAEVIQAMKRGIYDVIICNYANPDMVGHTGDFAATVKAIEVLDSCIKRLWEAAKSCGAELLITADHGNAEQMFDVASGQAHTAHTINPVPLLYVGRKANMAGTGSLEDVAPTMLYLMGLPAPSEMSGQSLVKLCS